MNSTAETVDWLLRLVIVFLQLREVTELQRDLAPK
jgi:hypothetical protein